MPIVNNYLTPYCPVLPLICSTRHPVSQMELAPRALDLLRDNRAIVISGRHQRDWELNRQIGKTTAVKNRLISALRKQGQRVSYFNAQKSVLSVDNTGLHIYNFAPLLRKASRLREADVYVLDEVHQAIPFKGSIRSYRRYRKPYAEAMMALWDGYSRMIEKGSKMVFVSCFHPHDPFFHDSMYNSAMALFFSSPVLELRAL